MRNLIFGCSLAAAFLVTGIAATPARALSWNDPEWAGLGCPSKLSGEWFPLTHSPYAGTKIEFKPSGAAISSNENKRVIFSFFPNSRDGQFLNLKRMPDDSIPFPKYIKIRPHIAVQSRSKGKQYTLCKIKVFLFESKHKANQMSYEGWDIYSTIDSPGAPHGN